VRGFLSSGRVAELGGEQRRLTIQFSDIKGFSSIAEKLRPEALVAEMSDYFVTVSAVLRTHRGTIGQIYGDGILAFYNAPDTLDGHEVNACLAALETQQRLLQDRALRRASGRPEFSVRIGLEVGDVIVGNIGTPERFAYNVIGDSVNLASRLENLCKYYGTSIIGTDELKRSTGTAFEWRHLDRVAVVGRLTSLDIYELLARAGDLPAAAAAQRNAYEAALADYFAGRFAEAETKFKALAATKHDDIATTLLAQRCEALQRHAPDGEWNGIYVHTSK
jgi:adenylate cyclase